MAMAGGRCQHVKACLALEDDKEECGVTVGRCGSLTLELLGREIETHIQRAGAHVELGGFVRCATESCVKVKGSCNERYLSKNTREQYTAP